MNIIEDVVNLNFNPSLIRIFVKANFFFKLWKPIVIFQTWHCQNKIDIELKARLIRVFLCQYLILEWMKFLLMKVKSNFWTDLFCRQINVVTWFNCLDFGVMLLWNCKCTVLIKLLTNWNSGIDFFFCFTNSRVGIRLPTVEVRFQNLTVEADSYVGSRALPTLPNVALNLLESALGIFGISTAKRTKLTILKNTSGIVKPSRYHNQVVTYI